MFGEDYGDPYCGYDTEDEFHDFCSGRLALEKPMVAVTVKLSTGDFADYITDDYADACRVARERTVKGYCGVRVVWLRTAGELQDAENQKLRLDDWESDQGTDFAGYEE
jgi:hypothetical protein